MPLGQDEAEVLRLVERQHCAIHGFAGMSEKGRLGIRSHARFPHIGQAGGALVMLIPYPTRCSGTARSLVGASNGRHTSISERIRRAPRAHRIRPWCLSTLAVEVQSSARDVRGGAGSAIDETARPLIHPGAPFFRSTPTSGASPTAAHAIGCPPTSREQPRRQDMQRRRIRPRLSATSSSPLPLFHAFLNGGSCESLPQRLREGLRRARRVRLPARGWLLL